MSGSLIGPRAADYLAKQIAQAGNTQRRTIGPRPVYGGSSFPYSFKCTPVTRAPVDPEPAPVSFIRVSQGFVIIDPLGAFLFGDDSAPPKIGSGMLVLLVPRDDPTSMSLDFWPYENFGYDADNLVIPLCQYTASAGSEPDTITITITMQHQLGNIYVGTQV